MKRTALIVAALMIGGSAIAQTGSTSDPDTTADPVTTEATTGTDMHQGHMDMDAGADAAAATDTSTPTTDDWSNTAGGSTATGVGGPYEAPGAGTPTAKGDYPPCDPGPGDDMCIQLYEAGVSTPTNLAMNRNLGDGSTMMASADTASGWTNEVDASTTAVGGPYEPVTGDSPDPYAAPVVREEGMTETTDAAGTDYPACAPGPGDDNCIQLYERGVTGIE